MPGAGDSVPERLRYLNHERFGHPSYYAVEGFELAVARRGVPFVANGGALNRQMFRALNKIGLARNMRQTGGRLYLSAMMGYGPLRLFPHSLWAETTAYCFDCWSPDYDRWEAFFRALRMRTVFISARQSAERMRARIPGLDAIWMPEAIDLSHYSPVTPMSARTIDVLEMGRRWHAYHDRIAPHCAQRGYVHRYEQVVGKLIFATRDDMYRGMANAKISVCVPSSLTHPARAGDVETMTVRYLESMASGAIVVGRCPAELRDLFGYAPVIEIDEDNPTGQIDSILADPDKFDALRQRNLGRLREVGTWDVRVDAILTTLMDRGY